MNHIHDNVINNIAGLNLPHGILNLSKRTKDVNYDYFPIIHGCMSTCRGRVIHKNAWLLLDRGCSSAVVIMRLMLKLLKTKYPVTQWQIQAGNITTDHKVKIYLTSPDFSVTKHLTWNFCVDDFAKSSYNVILGRYLLKV